MLDKNCRTNNGLTGWAMHQMAHMQDVMNKVGDDALEEEFYEELERDIENCVCCE